jgi:hypothetical protein
MLANGIRECDLWWFRELYAVLAAFADEPTNTINRIGGGRISIPEDQANDLHQFRRCILETYPHAADFEVMKVVAEIDGIFDRRNADGKSFDQAFWTNRGFQRHSDWDKIRELARAFLVR